MNTRRIRVLIGSCALALACLSTSFAVTAPDQPSSDELVEARHWGASGADRTPGASRGTARTEGSARGLPAGRSGSWGSASRSSSGTSAPGSPQAGGAPTLPSVSPPAAATPSTPAPVTSVTPERVVPSPSPAAPTTTPTPSSTPVAAASSAGAGPSGPAGSWTQVFGDEFDGPTLDTSRWRPNRFGGGGDDSPFNVASEGAFFSPDNVTVADGAAVLTIRPERATLNGKTYTHSSGTLSSEDSFALADGDYVEARLYVPTGSGLWPAFWTVPSNRWPPEIDVFEFFDSGRQSRPMFNYHPEGGGHSGPAVYGDPAVDYRNSWHTYGLHRTGGQLVPYVDGVAYPGAGVASGADSLDQFIILNLSMYDGAAPTAGTQMRVDWVRAWRPV